MELAIREIERDDLPELLELYTFLHDNPYPAISPAIEAIWSDILGDANHHILLGHADGKLVSSCVVVIVRNLTRGQRPYALIENVITHPGFRKRGCGSRVLAAARDLAAGENCYKIMLMTGSKEDGTLNFYRQAGYNSNDKTAFIQRLEG